MATYKETSHFEGSPAAAEHSLWFSGGSNPSGVAGQKGNHFLFELGSAGFGLFKTSGTTATLTGLLSNAAGQTYELMLNLVEYAGGGSVGYKNPFGKDTSLWDLYEIDNTVASTLNYMGDEIGEDNGDLQSFNITMRGGNNDGPYKVQVGEGANDKDAGLFGLSSWITLTDQDTNCVSNCSYAGDINVVLTKTLDTDDMSPVPLPASAFLLIGALGGLGAVARRRRKA